MAITLRKLVALDHLGLSIRACEEKLDRRIRWAYITDLIDPSPYLRGGELVLTNGLWRRRRSDSERFVATLSESGVCGLGYGLEAVTRYTPRDLIRACEHWSLPLLEVRHPVSFRTIAEAVVASDTHGRESALLHTLQRSRALFQAIARGSGVDGVLSVLARDRTLSPSLHDQSGRPMAATSHCPSPNELRAVRDAVTGAQSLPVDIPLDGHMTGSLFPVTALDHVEAYLLCRKPLASLTEHERDAIEDAIAVLGLEFAHLHAAHSMEMRFAVELVDFIAAGEHGRAETRARLHVFGLDPDGPLVVIVVELENGGRSDVERVAGIMETFFAARGVPLIAPQLAAEAIAIAGSTTPEPELHAVADELGMHLQTELPDVPLALGVGSVTHGVEHLRRSLIEARHACQFARLRKREPAVATYLDIGSHKLLFALHDEDVRVTFRSALLRPLLQYDRRRNADLVHSLDVFLHNCGQWQKSAEELHIHVNSLRHRVSRIEALTGRDLSSMDDRVDFYIALRPLEEPAML